MGTHVIKVPDIGEGIAEVELVAWHVAVGDDVREDQALADVMTDKANVEIPSPVSGKVTTLGGKPGDVLAVGSELIRIEVAGDADRVEDASAPRVASEPAMETPEATRDAVATEAAEPREPSARPASGKPHIPASAVSRKERGTAEEGAPQPATRARDDGFDKPLASPAVRRHARELGIALEDVAGTGDGGRITHEDLERHVARDTTPARGAGVERSDADASRARGAHEVRSDGDGDGGGRGAGKARSSAAGGDESIPVIGLRRRIAQRMQASKRRIPHFTYVEEVDVTELEALRAALNAKHGASRAKLTLLPFLVRAIVCAAPDFPQVNARFEDDDEGGGGTLTRFRAVHVGIATQTDGGLVVPVVRDAGSLDLWGCAAEIARLADAARAGRASREELSGSTITITSLGPLGGIVTTPVINYPEVAIVGVNRIVERPVIRAGAIVPRLVMNLSSSFDHRVVDGMDAARFVQALRGYLETPATLFLD
jgi:2-oxoisovalerate dehydrogenase E2 component (dihydrolipoyl transacylase)